MGTTVIRMDSPPAAYTVAVAKTVTRALTTSGFTVKSLAEATRIPRVTIQRKIAGVTPFNTTELAAIATCLDTTPADLLYSAQQSAA